MSDLSAESQAGFVHGYDVLRWSVRLEVVTWTHYVASTCAQYPNILGYLTDDILDRTEWQGLLIVHTTVENDLVTEIIL